MIAHEIENTSIVECLNTNCMHHLETRGRFSCNLKRIMISGKGRCKAYQKLGTKQLSHREEMYELMKKERTMMEKTKARIKEGLGVSLPNQNYKEL